jgi:cell division protein FtsW (lipid II flippase)
MRWCLRRVMDALAVPGERRLAHEPDLVLLLTLLGLVTFGMVMVFSASVGE